MQHTVSNIAKSNINNTNIDHYTSTIRKIIAIRANALLVSYDDVLVAMVTTGQPELLPPAGGGIVD